MKPVLLLIPGLLNTPAVFDRLRAQLDPAIDLRIATVQTQASLAAMAADAWALLADVKPIMQSVGPVRATAQTRALMQRPDRRPLLPAMRLACRVVGGANDAITLPAWSREMAELIPNARLTLLPGMGHMLPLERPAELAAALHDMLQQVQLESANAPTA